MNNIKDDLEQAGVKVWRSATHLLCDDSTKARAIISDHGYDLPAGDGPLPWLEIPLPTNFPWSEK